MNKPQPLISFWDGSSRTLRAYLNMEKRMYGMFGTNYTGDVETYLMQFKIGKDGVNDTADYLNFNKLHGRITPTLIDNKKTLLLDFWEFNEDEVKPFLVALEQSVHYYLQFAPVDDENHKTSQLLMGAKVSIGGKILSKNGQDYTIAQDILSKDIVPPLMEMYLG
ncbi:hypothetical protein [Candidatus Uabimicrobium amorphum]|uniref:Uncharacterized protein n=1 Tax=Uabimicrobium amorphum TaxID=2596890 RepID=A0A5S9IIY9_UABAM|nr:hypothetical protein [Candidatus Uabimicrobium amorphum]BBM82316.1 hypothetical protein UABAM_00659 [Candidatus Uabimicrobium amorphum]